MGNRESRVLLSVVDKFSQPLAKFAGGLEGAYEKVNGLKRGLQTLAGGGGGVAGAVISTVIDATKYTLEWSSTIDDLTRATGASAREASKLAVVFGDVGISTDTLKLAMKKMTAEGITLNMETIKQLAEEYKSLPPGVARTQFAFEKFGRAGMQMSEILDRDASEIEALGRAAERSGKVIGEDMVNQSEHLETSMHQLQDRMEGFKILVGEPVVDTVNKAADAFQNYVGIYQLLAIKVELATGSIDQNTASVKAAQVAGLSYAEAVNQVYAAEVDTHDSTIRLGGAVDNLTSSYATLGVGTQSAADITAQYAIVTKTAADKAYELEASQRELAAGLEGPLRDATTLTNEEFSKLTNSMLFQAAAAAGLKDPALTELAHSMGLIDEASYNAQKQMDILTKQYQDGKLSADGYAAATKNAADAINALQDKHVQITIDTIYYEERRQSGQYVPHEQGAGGMAGGYQFGGLVPAMKPVLVGERGPELVRLDKPGRVQSDTAGGGSGSGDIAQLITEFMALTRALPTQMKLAMRSA